MALLHFRLFISINSQNAACLACSRLVLLTGAIIKKYRVLDAAFYQRLEKGNVYVCERHYAPEDIEQSSS